MDQRIIDTITTAIPGSTVRLASGDGVHYQAVVIADAFAGMPLVRQHQMVMNALRSEFDTDRLHALQLKTLTPAQVQQQQQQQ